ncbi:MAG: helix-turn-helix transcriptional regulator [Desulfobulbus sp.]|nr:helix-turn-helix transcriptional regulator [Desulfobulbus sp.]
MSSKKNLLPDNLGSRLKKYRLEKSLTGNKLAEIIGISQGSLSEIENGKREPSGKVFYGLAENTDIDIKWLITGEKTGKGQEKSARAEKVRKFNILNQAEEWLTVEVGKNPKKEIWFEVEFEKTFEEFKKWKEEKEESAAEEAYSSSRKVA